ncbi:MAG: DUF4982 domain-containing protein [Duncaniella sp.]|nr:DUF4982 domain-containing protein [Duncaniella sp.]
MKRLSSILSLSLLLAMGAQGADRKVTTLTDGWQFTKGEASDASKWQNVKVPHDWAIYGPFDRANDLQEVAIKQNGETEKTWKTGRTGGLPFIGKGEYRTTFNVPDTAGRSFTVIFDGAMSNPEVFLNGKPVGKWGFGYNTFYLNLDNAIQPGENTLEVKLENKERASRWYPGAGLYRNVHIIETNKVHVPVWGTYITTPKVTREFASVNLKTEIEGAAKGQKLKVVTTITNPQGQEVAKESTLYPAHGQEVNQNFLVDRPELWSINNPALYTATTRIYSEDDKELDSYETRFGIRNIEYLPDMGFYLNDSLIKFQGVCLHHDLGPLGAAVNKSAIRHQLEMLKDMGVNAVRTSHNMPAPELVELCDEMGIMLMVEAFDDWSFRPKSPNGYGSIFDEWWERDITNMVKHYRNNPSVVMWSHGNEVPSQWDEKNGIATMLKLQNLIHELDPTRPVTNGMDQIRAVLTNGFAAALDIPGFNYKPQYYEDAYEKLGQKLILGSETASTVSSRGVYKFPVEVKKTAMYNDNQSSSYDVEACSWSNIPDIDFAADDDLPYVIGQFVWTGFDYLGEPTPYDTDAWPSHSSYFGIIDLASLPKDRYYLYRSKWNKEDNTLHILPHWNWKGREGEVTPVFVYTNFPKAELFINGKSQGMREKNDSTVMNRYRLMWNETVYEPGEVKVVAYDSLGNVASEKSIRTTGKPHHLVLTPNRTSATADGEELVYVTVQVADKDGNIVPTADNMVSFTVTGNGKYEAGANGDATSLLSFQEPKMKLFSGAATAILRTSDIPGTMTLKATAPGVKPASVTITTTK